MKDTMYCPNCGGIRVIIINMTREGDLFHYLCQDCKHHWFDRPLYKGEWK